MQMIRMQMLAKRIFVLEPSERYVHTMSGSFFCVLFAPERMNGILSAYTFITDISTAVATYKTICEN